jgi:hypothetical protein
MLFLDRVLWEPETVHRIRAETKRKSVHSFTCMGDFSRAAEPVLPFSALFSGASSGGFGARF